MLKLRTQKGKVVLFSAYAPPQTPNHPVNERQECFHSLAQFWSEVSCNGPKVVLGDFNSRLYARLPGEEDMIGDSIVRYANMKLKADMNRFLLMQLCSECDLQVVNTFSGLSVAELVTHRDIW